MGRMTKATDAEIALVINPPGASITAVCPVCNAPVMEACVGRERNHPHAERAVQAREDAIRETLERMK